MNCMLTNARTVLTVLVRQVLLSPLLLSLHEQQATNAAALLALLSLQPHLPLHRHLARPYADIWTHLQEQASEWGRG